MSALGDPYRASTFEDFWPSYLAMHSRPETQRLHALATITAIGCVAAGLATGHLWLVVLAPLADHAIAQVSHRLFEKNRTTPWRNPWWHARAELRMFRSVVSGALGQRAIRVAESSNVPPSASHCSDTRSTRSSLWAPRS